MNTLRFFIASILFASLSTSIFSEDKNRGGAALDVQRFDGAINYSERYLQRVADGDPTLLARISTRNLFSHALFLCEAGRHDLPIDALLAEGESLQDVDPESPTYGNFGWYRHTPEVTDRNAVEFIGHTASPLWILHRDRLPTATRKRLKRILERMVDGCLLHRASPAYTNIALSNAGNLIVLGEQFDRPEAIDEGRRRLTEVLVLVWQGGFNEYSSSTYYGVNLDALHFIEKYAKCRQSRDRAKAMIRLLWADMAANWFPILSPYDVDANSDWDVNRAWGRLGGTTSRTYDYLGCIHECLHRHLRAINWLPPHRSPAREHHFARPGEYRPDVAMRTAAYTQFPRHVRQRWGVRPEQWRAITVHRDIALSVSAATYWNSDIPMAIDFSAACLGIDARPEQFIPHAYFIADGREDPYGKKRYAAGSAGHRKALHLRPFWTATQRGNDAIGFVRYQSKDWEAEEVTNLQSHIVLPEPQSLTIDGRPIAVPDRSVNAEIAIGARQAIVLRYETAAVGIRVMKATDKAGNAAKIRLVDDGNPFDVLRLTVEHESDTAKAEPVAAYQVRIGPNLDNDESFEQWQRDFLADRATVIETSDDVIRIAAPTENTDGEISVAVRRNRADLLTAVTVPGRPNDILEVDGRAVGRRILETCPELTEYKRLLHNTKSIQIHTDVPTEWEAEEAVAFPNNIREENDAMQNSHGESPTADPPRASGGKYLTVNHRAIYRLDVLNPGDYYLWARIGVDDKKHDSVWVTLATETEELLHGDWHLSSGSGWHWCQMRLAHSKGATPLPLPAGACTLELSPRELDSRFDRIFLTTDPDARPE